MLHLENFFEKSFALLLTTPKFGIIKQVDLQNTRISGIMLRMGK